LIEYTDESNHVVRLAWLHNGKVQCCLYLADKPVSADNQWLASPFVKPAIDELDRLALLSGRLPSGMEDTGKIVCACFSVGEKTIETAIEADNLTDVTAIGERLKAGTNCVSCLPELHVIVKKNIKPL